MRWGGYVALDVAISHPDRVTSLVLACRMMGVSEPEYTRTLQSLRPRAFDDLLCLRLQRGGGGVRGWGRDGLGTGA